ncbi:hypothetical protein MUK42_09703 [Musa troglodytarum]|uniref:Uncharacterized protein n=1 Tax=Musa troglodytarum TaxID=320322 RepID=A0A9E7EAM9_9LILI|nr:hypothetical protein MUK42_09703 [Musa troglodytarum]
MSGEGGACVGGGGVEAAEHGAGTGGEGAEGEGGGGAGGVGADEGAAAGGGGGRGEPVRTAGRAGGRGRRPRPCLLPPHQGAFRPARARTPRHPHPILFLPFLVLR